METNHEKTSSFFRFEDLRIYRKSLEYLTFLNARLTRIPFDQKEMIALPFYAAARNITNQVAEGASRNKNQFIYYLKLAKTSIRECVTLTTICRDAGHFDEQEAELSRQTLKDLTKMIGALIASLVRSGVKECLPTGEPVIVEEELDLRAIEEN